MSQNHLMGLYNWITLFFFPLHFHPISLCFHPYIMLQSGITCKTVINSVNTWIRSRTLPSSGGTGNPGCHKGATGSSQGDPCRHRDLNTHAEGRYLCIWAAALTWVLSWALRTSLFIQGINLELMHKLRWLECNPLINHSSSLANSAAMQLCLPVVQQIPFSAVLCEYNGCTSRSGSKYSSNP